MKVVPFLLAAASAGALTLVGCEQSQSSSSASTAGPASLGNLPGTRIEPRADQLPRSEAYAVVDGERVAVPDIEMGEPAMVEAAIREGRDNSRVMEHLSTLSLDFGARLTGSKALEDANYWAADQFREWGLKNVEVRQWGTVPVRFDRLDSSGKMFLGPGDDGTDVAFTTLAWVKGTGGPVRGEAVPFPESYEEFDSDPDRYTGAWVLHQANHTDRRFSPRRLMSLREGQMREIRSGGDIDQGGSGPAVGAERWAGQVQVPTGDGESVAMDLIVDTRRGRGGIERAAISAGGGDFSQVRIEESDRNSFTGDWSTANGVLRVDVTIDGDSATGTATGEILQAGPGAITLAKTEIEAAPSDRPSLLKLVMERGPAGFVSSSQDDRVWTSAARGWSERDLSTYIDDIEVNIDGPSYDFIMARMDQGLSVDLEFNLNNRVTAGPIPVYNTIAEIPGTEKPDEVVIMSAHLDSWNGPGSTGTVDNATGSSVTMEAARILATVGVKPKRTIRFVLWTGEEQGLLGSRAYVESLSDEERAKISACFVDDGGTNYQGGVPVTDAMVNMFAAATAPINGRFTSETDRAAQLFDDDPSNDATAGLLEVNIRPVGDRLPRGGGSDHAAFNAVGIPGFFWDEVGRANYRYAWHTQNDNMEQAIPEYLSQSATNSAVVIYNLACAPTLLPRVGDPDVASAD
ncbi:MAG: M20/M25/M40 family metallo-hydrolase [Planctomycetota bacterium]